MRDRPKIVPTLPVIDIALLLDRAAPAKAKLEVVTQIREACIRYGFFYITGYGITLSLEDELEAASRQFFALPSSEKERYTMREGGRAWRGWFPVGAELTSGQEDLKEGIYFGEDLALNHPEVLAQTPMHGANLYPTDALRSVVPRWLNALCHIGHALMDGIALSLNIEPEQLRAHGMRDPLQLFRVFHYPPSRSESRWGVGEHTDYGLLTILKQDDRGGLEVKIGRGGDEVWIEAPPLERTLIVNIGDMLEKITHGRYLSTPHRVKNRSGQSRLSFPYFFDPNYYTELGALSELTRESQRGRARWDGVDLHQVSGTYGDYLLTKVARVFPQLISDLDRAGS